MEGETKPLRLINDSCVWTNCMDKWVSLASPSMVIFKVIWHWAKWLSYQSKQVSVEGQLTRHCRNISTKSIGFNCKLEFWGPRSSVHDEPWHIWATDQLWHVHCCPEHGPNIRMTVCQLHCGPPTADNGFKNGACYVDFHALSSTIFSVTMNCNAAYLIRF